MKRICLALLSLPLVAAARDKAPPGFYEAYTGFAISAEPVLPAHETHPSLWFKSGDVPALKTKLTDDDFARSRWTAIL